MFESIRVASVPSSAVLVVGYFQGEAGAAATLDKATKAHDHDGSIAGALKRGEATGDLGKITDVFPSNSGRGGKTGKGPSRVLLIGLGKKGSLEAASFRTLGGAIGRRLAAIKESAASIELAGALAGTKVDAEDAGSAFGEGLGLIGWVCDQFKGKATPAPTRVRLSVGSSSKSFAAGVERGLALAVSANFARTLSETPPNIATPAYMASQAQKLAKQTGLKCRIFEGKDLERERFEGLINVGKASENKPRMIRLEYTPKNPKRRGKPIVLIGKTMTYDSGGLSLKINNGMVGMKRDKDGGCAVLGAMHAIATVIKPRRGVVALLAAAENSISDEAYRPDDVLRYRNDVTVEVTNTDAEGRLVLADALCGACEKERPAALIDLATLTGGVITALGSTYAGMFCDDDGLRAKVEAAASASGERVWRLPMHAEYREMMKSPVADIVNSNPNRKAHAGQGAAFLSYFVGAGVPWCHLDIAGVHVAERNAGPYIEGPTGWGVRLLANLVDAG